MNLYDIRVALIHIAKINKDLNKERLTTLLEASAWEKQDVTDALAMWESGEIASHKEEDVSPEQKDIYPEIPPTHEVTIPEDSFSFDETKTSEATSPPEVFYPLDEKVSEEEKPPVAPKEVHHELPDDLPLRPYETSVVSVPLAEYKKRFLSHVQTMPTDEVTVNSKVTTEPQPEKELEEPLRKTPFELEDTYLVGLTIVLFLTVMILLGYMYTNGRL